MNPPSEDVKDMITQSNGVGTFGTNVFIGAEPLIPDECVTIYDTGGFDPETHNDIFFPTVNIRVRGVMGGYKAAYAKALAIVTLLNGLRNETWSATRYIQIFMVGDINTIGNDDSNRPLLTINFRIIRT